MIFAAYWQRQAHDLKVELREYREKYAVMVEHYRKRGDILQATVERLDAAKEREASLREYVNLVELERDDARREVDEVRAALVWLEDKWFKKGGVA